VHTRLGVVVVVVVVVTGIVVLIVIDTVDSSSSPGPQFFCMMLMPVETEVSLPLLRTDALRNPLYAV